MSNKNNSYSKEILNIKISKITEIGKKKKEEINKISINLKSVKLQYNTKVLEFKNINNTILTEEKEIEEKKNLISKNIKRNKKILQSINTKEFNFLKEMTEEKNQFECFKHLFLFCGLNENNCYKDILTIMKTPDEFINLLIYSTKINENIFNNEKSNKEIPKIKKEIESFLFNEKSLQNPFDIIFEFIQNIYKNIDLNSEIKVLEGILDKEIENKNNQFIKLKKLESEIIKIDNIYSKTHKYLKLIKIFLKEYKCEEENPPKTKIKELNSSLNKFLEYDFDSNESIDQLYNQIILNLNIKIDSTSEFSDSEKSSNYVLNNIKNFQRHILNERNEQINKESTIETHIEEESICEEIGYKNDKLIIKSLKTARGNTLDNINLKKNIKKKRDLVIENVVFQKNDNDKSICGCHCQ